MGISLTHERKVLKASVEKMWGEKCEAKKFRTLLSLTIFRPTLFDRKGPSEAEQAGTRHLFGPQNRCHSSNSSSSRERTNCTGIDRPRSCHWTAVRPFSDRYSNAGKGWIPIDSNSTCARSAHSDRGVDRACIDRRSSKVPKSRLR